MKKLSRFVPCFISLIALTCASCSAPNTTTVVNSLAPVITSFSPDTVWTFNNLTIHGANFGYDPQNVLVHIDTVLAQLQSTDDTVLTVAVPENARTGLVHVWSYEQTATSAKPLVVNYSFRPHTFSTDSVPEGGSFSIPGTGMNNYRGNLSLYLNETVLPIDSVFSNRIVSHVIPNCFSGGIAISDSAKGYFPGTLIVTRPSAWKTLSEIWDNLTIEEFHHRTGIDDGHPIDSSWQTTVTYSRQIDSNIAGTPFARTAQGVDYSLTQPNNTDNPLVQITWDTVRQTAQVSFHKYSYIPTTTFHSGDTLWFENGDSREAFLPIDGDIEFSLPGFGYQINEDSTNASGIVNWQETTITTITSGSFNLIFKQ